MSPWTHLPPAGDVPGFRLFGGTLQTPALDERQYRILELQNGLRAVLVHDPAADKAAASLALTAGYLLDPDNAPGLAHFCEHMITKGSDAYPAENDYHSLISTNGGTRNAVTGPGTTEYWFSLSPSALAEGLLRLASFLHAPLFTASLAAREINAVDSEYKRNLQNDARRVLQVTRSLSVRGHPWAKFGTGNYETLSGAGRRSGAGATEEVVLGETRRRLAEWWKATYCASRMTLAVIGRESIEDLTSLVVPHFSKIPNRGLDPRPTIKEEVWDAEQMGTIVFIETVKDSYGFSLTFPLPDLRAHYATKPASFIAHFLGHEGPGSVCAHLKNKGWLLNLSAGASRNAYGIESFKISGQLTLKGYLHYRDVLDTLFAYIVLLRASHPLPPYHLAEVHAMAHTRFRFQEKTAPHRYASTLAHLLAHPVYPPEALLSGAYLYQLDGWDGALVQRLLDGFVPGRARVTLEAKAHREEIVGSVDVRWETERWYGTRYVVRRLEEGLLRKLEEPTSNAELHLPAPNPFIPEDLSVDRVMLPEPLKYPLLVKCTGLSQLWHKKDDQFWVPKAQVRVDIKSPLAYTTPRHAMLTRLLVNVVEDALAEVTYDADLAGVSYSVMNQIEGLTVAVGGYCDKLPALLRIVLETVRGLRVQPDRLRVVKEEVQREYENFYMSQPSHLSETYAGWMFMPTVWTPAEKLQELLTINESDVEHHRDALLSRIFIEALVNGNVSRERSLEILSLVEECLQSEPLLPCEIPRQRSLALPPGSDIISRKRHANPKEVNSSLSYYLQFCEVPDRKLRTTLALIAHILHEPCYSILRTEEQLGYVVACSQWSINGTLGLGIRIQSIRPPPFLESRVDAFLERMGDRIAGLSAEEFTQHKEGLVVKTLERAKNLNEETARFWGQIRSGCYDFLKKEEDAALVCALALSEVVASYDALVRPSTGAQTRKKLSIHLVSHDLHVHSPTANAPENSGIAHSSLSHPTTDTGPDVPTTAGVIPETADEATRAALARRPTRMLLPEADATAEAAFKTGLACAPAARPVISAAFGDYAEAFVAQLGCASGGDTSAHAAGRGKQQQGDDGCGAPRPTAAASASARL
ncbi:LuxS/MPP-like metallohydrolase [Trametes gibbosa]|nr:LuxS/MPP-like metallohydrolase [Trametes gibbosa]